MKIQNLKTKVIGPALLLLPMACMHLGDGHHSGPHHSLTHQPPYQSSVYDKMAEGMFGHGRMTIHQDSGNEK
jgi:hypothetical protein